MRMLLLLVQLLEQSRLAFGVLGASGQGAFEQHRWWLESGELGEQS